MKRDLDLIRLILMQSETGQTPEAMEKVEFSVVLYHYELAIEAGLLVGTVDPPEGDCEGGARIERLTWEGHDFLDLARSETLWAKVKEELQKKGVGWTIEIAKAMLVYHGRRWLGLPEEGK